MLLETILVTLQVVYVQADLGSDLVFCGGLLERGELADQELDGLWLQIVKNKVDEPLKVLVGKGVACRM